STVISAFNSLTLSPALTALLLKPRDKTEAPPLPWLAFPLLGGVAGWLLLRRPLAVALHRLGPLLPENLGQALANAPAWLNPWLAIVCGIAGRLATGGSANMLSGGIFHG